MTEDEKSPPAEPLPAAHHFSSYRPGLFTGAVFAASALVVAIYFGCQFVRMHMAPAATVATSSTAVVVQLEQRVAALEQKTQSINSRVDDLGARVDKNTPISVSTELPEPQPVPAASAAPSAAATAQVAHMQNDVTALSAALAALQAEVKQSGSAVAETQQGMQNLLAAAVAFIQLQEAAAAGHGFMPELAALRSVAGSGFQELLARLDPYAAKGAPTMAALREEFLALETPASVALAKATAQNWHERLLADMKGLISIRSVHGGNSSADFPTAEDALASGDIAAALDTIKPLPAEAQAVFADWKSEAEARLGIDTAMHAIAGRFIVPSPANTQDRP